jgi:predicted aldo/keto reductase-like oxidoreductase
MIHSRRKADPDAYHQSAGKERIIIMSDYLGKDTPKLGFGLMRLPFLDGNRDNIDIEQLKKMVDMFMDAGMTYFDTAFVYGKNGASERAAKEALVDRYPRESFTLASKLNTFVRVNDRQDAIDQLDISLERTGAGYFDYYLLHSVEEETIDGYDKYGIWDFVKEKKAEGLIKHWGFSFHGMPDMLDEVLTEHPDAEFVQLQLNYADWDDPTVMSGGVYEVALRHNKPIVVMEPVKGGLLATLPEPAAKLLTDFAPDASQASWAIRYAASLDNIIAVLSGMSNIEQMENNLSFMRDFKPLSDGEKSVIDEVRTVLKEVDRIPCTACRYCSVCPQDINIPGAFWARNIELVYGDKSKAKFAYRSDTLDTGKAMDCIECGSCEAVCPQHISIIDNLKVISDAYDKK